MNLRCGGYRACGSYCPCCGSWMPHQWHPRPHPWYPWGVHPFVPFVPWVPCPPRRPFLDVNSAVREGREAMGAR